MAWSRPGSAQVAKPLPDPALLLDELEAHDARLVRTVLRPEHPLELLGGHDRHHAVATLPLGGLQIGPDMIHLAVVEAGAVRLLQRQHRDVVLRGKGLHLPAEPVADHLEESWRGHRIAEVVDQEQHHLATHLHVGDIGVQVEAIDTLDFQGDVALQDLVNVDCQGQPLFRRLTARRKGSLRFGSHPRSCARAGSAGPTEPPATGLGGSRGEGLPSSRWVLPPVTIGDAGAFERHRISGREH